MSTDAPSSLTLRVGTADGVTVVHCRGRLTAEVSAEFKERIRALAPQTKLLVLDLSRVTFLDSAGLGAVVGLYVSAKASGRDLKLVNFSQRVRELLGMTRLLAVFEDCGQYNARMP